MKIGEMTDEQLRELAHEQYVGATGDAGIDIDDDALVSRPTDDTEGHAWVQAWVLVRDPDA